jgi:ABC-type glutathione transport system ATPase component
MATASQPAGSVRSKSPVRWPRRMICSSWAVPAWWAAGSPGCGLSMSKKIRAGDGPAIEARGLVKVYGGTRALDGIDLTVRRGEVFGFLGLNGAGKTSAIRILATLARPGGGTARVLGLDVVSEADAIRARVAVTGRICLGAACPRPGQLSGGGAR